MRLIRLAQQLNRESHGGHLDNGASKLLSILNTLDEIHLTLEEQERWLRDNYALPDFELGQLADESVQTFLSALLTNIADFGEDYLMRQLCEEGGYEAVLKALERYREHIAPPFFRG